jgi:hypothetical protein
MSCDYFPVGEPTVITLNIEDVTVVMPETATLNCDIEPGKPEAEVKWYVLTRKEVLLFLLRLGVRAASNFVYSGYPELWILRYPAHRYCVVPSPGFEPTTLWLRVRRPNHLAMTLHSWE